MHDGFHVYHFSVPHHWNEDDCENHLGRKTHVSSNGYSNRKHGLIKEIIKCLMKHQLSLAYYMCGIFRSPSWATSWSLLSEDGSHCMCPLPTDGPCLVEQNKKKKNLFQPGHFHQLMHAHIKSQAHQHLRHQKFSQVL